ncbi:S26 family signal peptidase [Halopiger djelfimassiliensis]|uniref:S26 family signal peptidase n=1 Tax=Halopiger djelfimassiliensis TaxID=1293047 RepID=UPI00067810D1|nr:S26 family signal peptidase [Halopiger djelfimassiliensis]
MSGSNPGDPADDPDGGGHGRDGRDHQERTTGSERNPPERSTEAAESSTVTIEDDGVVRWFLRTEDDTVVVVRDVLSSVALVAVLGLVLFAVSGIWPPLVAVESGSMEPNMERGDLIFVVDNGRFVGDGPVDGTGIVTRESGAETGHEKFGNPGDVIVFKPDGSEYRTPVIHRAHFWVEEGENWVDTKANEEYVGGATCTEVQTCPAEYDGFITKGDDNPGYDQVRGGAKTDVVKPEWITGKAMVRIPWLGHIRLTFDKVIGGMVVPTPSPTPGIGGATAAGSSPSAGPTETAGVSGLTGVATGVSAGLGAGVALTGRRYRN